MKRNDPVDPYDLLRQAKAIFESYPRQGDGPREQWLLDFKKLPGANLSKKAVRVLRDVNLRCPHNAVVVDKLKEEGYLQEVHQIRGNPGRARRYTVVRINNKGRQALALRKDVD